MIWYVIKYDESRTSKSIRPKLLCYLILYTAEYLVAISGYPLAVIRMLGI
jgi:hypothetical protein